MSGAIGFKLSPTFAAACPKLAVSRQYRQNAALRLIKSLIRAWLLTRPAPVSQPSSSCGSTVLDIATSHKYTTEGLRLSKLAKMVCMQATVRMQAATQSPSSP